MLSRLKEYREDQVDFLKVSEDERHKMYQMKNGTFEGEIDYLRNLIKTLERRMDDESAFRIKNEDDLRQWFDQKVGSLTEQVRNEERMSLEREKRIIAQFQEGLSTINEIVRGSKE